MQGARYTEEKTGKKGALRLPPLCPFHGRNLCKVRGPLEQRGTRFMTPYPRRKTRKIHVGNVPIGGDAPIAVQSMTNTDTRDARSTLRQIRRLAEAGCEIVRLAVPDRRLRRAFKEMKARVAGAPDRRHPFRSPPGPGRPRGRGGRAEDQSGKYRGPQGRSRR